MTACPYILFYVKDTQRSAAFYSPLLGLQPVESSPTFVLYVLESGVKLGLWAVSTVAPAATLTGGGAEVAFTVADSAALETTYAAWAALGVKLVQEPTDMDFGRTFAAVDPDGHRLRMFAPAMM
jgi:catechol 2,3-dioxygenase-like lactoylglutathione lyase family enzyme